MAIPPHMSAADYMRVMPRQLLHNEEDLQIAMCEWLDLTVPHLIYFGSAAGGKRHPAVAARLKRMGVRAGEPDLEFLLPSGRVLFVEVKTPSGALKPSQRDLHPRMAAAGHPVHIARSIDDLAVILAEHGVQTRESFS